LGGADVGGGGAGWLGSSAAARARETSTSSWVRFFDWRKAMRFSRGALATDGSCRTAIVRMKHVSLAMVATYKKSTRGQ
jgi:hypothetical protein